MNDETASAPAEGEALPTSVQKPEGAVKTFFDFHAAERALISPVEAAERAIAGIEAWYAKHFHHATLAGVAPIPADQKTALIAHVTAAINPVKE